MVIPLKTSGFAANCWLLYDESTSDAVLIDPSAPLLAVREELTKRRLVLQCILLTHGHFDHILYLDQVRNDLSVPAAMHKDDEPFLFDPVKNASAFMSAAPVVAASAEILLKNGQKLSLGSLEVTCVHTPGHSPGSVSYLCRDALFTGDTLFDRGVGRTDLAGGSEQELCGSLKTIAAMDPGLTVYPGHGPESTLREQLLHNPYLRGLSI